jgi:hypothetical protein
LDIKRALAETDRRVSIIAEHYLRREIAREEALRRDAPDWWHRVGKGGWLETANTPS